MPLGRSTDSSKKKESEPFMKAVEPIPKKFGGRVTPQHQPSLAAVRATQTSKL